MKTSWAIVWDWKKAISDKKSFYWWLDLQLHPRWHFRHWSQPFSVTKKGWSIVVVAIRASDVWYTCMPCLFGWPSLISFLGARKSKHWEWDEKLEHFHVFKFRNWLWWVVPECQSANVKITISNQCRNSQENIVWYRKQIRSCSRCQCKHENSVLSPNFKFHNFLYCFSFDVIDFSKHEPCNIENFNKRKFII